MGNKGYTGEVRHYCSFVIFFASRRLSGMVMRRGSPETEHVNAGRWERMSAAGSPGWFAPTLSALRERRDLAAGEMAVLVEGMLRGECDAEATAELLVALRDKGETAQELAAAAGVMRRLCQRFDVGDEEVLDT